MNARTPTVAATKSSSFAYASGYSQAGTRSFFDGVLQQARLRAPHKPYAINDVREEQRRGSRNNGDPLPVSQAEAAARLFFVRENPWIMLAVQRVMSDLLSGGVALEVTDGGKRLELSDEQKESFDHQLRKVADAVFLHRVALGYAAVEVVRDEDTPGSMVLRILDPSEYTLKFSRRAGHTRRYEIFSNDETAVVMPHAHLLMFEEPSESGRHISRLNPVRRLLAIAGASVEDQYYAHFHRTHLPWATQPTAGVSRDARAEVANGPLYADGEVGDEIAEKREHLNDAHREEQEDAVADASNAADVAADDAAHKYAAYTGISEQEHPSVEAALAPPYAHIFRVGLDRQLVQTPVPQLDPGLANLLALVSGLAFAMVGATPAMSQDVVEKTATESSIQTHYYNNAVARLQSEMSNQLSHAWRQLSGSMFRALVKARHRPTAAETGAADDDVRLAQKQIRRKAIADDLSRLTVFVRFRHVPLVAPADIAMLEQTFVISSETATMYRAAYHSLPQQDVLDTEEKRNRERKRRLAEQEEETQRMAVASTVAVPPTEPGGAPKIKRVPAAQTKPPGQPAPPK